MGLCFVQSSMTLTHVGFRLCHGIANAGTAGVGGQCMQVWVGILAEGCLGMSSMRGDSAQGE